MISHRTEACFNPFAENHIGSVADPNSFRGEQANPYFQCKANTFLVYLIIISLMWVFIVQGYLSASSWERVPLHCERCCALSV